MTNNENQNQLAKSTTFEPLPPFSFLDAPTGYGKTTAIIERVRAGGLEDRKRFLVVTPYLSEIERICKETNCIAPVANKHLEIKQLLANGNNVCCSHSLCNLLDLETLEIIKYGGYNYSLIIDEEPAVITNITGYQRKHNKENPSVIERYSSDDLDFCVSNNLITIDDVTGKITLNDEKVYNGIFDDLKRRSQIADLFKEGESIIQMTKTALWCAFTDVIVCSYRMQESFIKYYCDIYKIPVNWLHIENRQIVEGYLSLKPIKTDKIIIGTAKEDYSLSKYWYNNNIRPSKGYFSKDANNLKNSFRYFREKLVPKGIDKKKYYWTCYKGYDKALADKNLSKRKWKPCNLKATNDLASYQLVGYLVNRFTNIAVKSFLNKQGIKVNEKEIALSELIQFVWRSNIRTSEAKDIYVFVGSQELAKDFEKWLKE